LFGFIFSLIQDLRFSSLRKNRTCPEQEFKVSPGIAV
jgi:hypothetical protein